MSTFHPGITRGMAEDLAHEVTKTSAEPIDRAAVIQAGLARHACRAAGLAGNDPSEIERLVWYRGDGWEHGGSAVTWKERAEELEAELSVKNALIDRAKAELEPILNEQSAEIGTAAVRRITKLLTDIEHL